MMSSTYATCKLIEGDLLLNREVVLLDVRRPETFAEIVGGNRSCKTGFVVLSV